MHFGTDNRHMGSFYQRVKAGVINCILKSPSDALETCRDGGPGAKC